MPGLDDAKKRAEEMPQGGGFNTYPELRLEENEIAYVRFCGTGASDDLLTESALFHQVQRVSKKSGNPYQQSTYCARSFDDKEAGEKSECEYCDGIHGMDAAKVRLQIGMWLWVTSIIRSKPRDLVKNPGPMYEQEMDSMNRPFFVERLNAPLVWTRGPGQKSEFLDRLTLMRDLGDGLNNCVYTITRRGSGRDDTKYNLDPVKDTKGKAWEPEVLEVIKGLPSIRELFSGAETYPRTMQNNPDNEMITAESLQTLNPSEPAKAGIKKSKESGGKPATPAELLTTAAPPEVQGKSLF